MVSRMSIDVHTDPQFARAAALQLRYNTFTVLQLDTIEHAIKHAMCVTLGFH